MSQKGEWLDDVFQTAAEAQQAATDRGLDPKKAVQAYPGSLGRFPKPIPAKWLAELYRRYDMVPKAELKDGAWYAGRCRNSNLAQWDAKRSVFVHWREKFGRLFPETINHPEDDDGFDLFWPAQALEPAIKLEDIRGREMAALFRRYIGIDYSGAETPTSGLIGLQVYEGGIHEEATLVSNPEGGGRKWTRKAIARWLLEQLAEGPPTIVGIDHAFSFPVSYLDRYGLERWGRFLDDFCQHWPTDEDNTYVDFIREKNPARTGERSEFRLTDCWSSSAKSIFQYDGPGTVGKSTHAGIPWLRFLRRNERLNGKVHFWPFDGFVVPQNKSVIAEVYPSILRRRYRSNPANLNQHAVDAYSIVKWLQATDYNGILPRYFEPPLMAEEQLIARREGWILGIG